MRSLVLALCALTGVATVAAAQSAVSFDAYHLGLADTWKPPFVPYTYVRKQDSSTGEEKYLFAATDFNKLKALTGADCSKAPCSVRVVKAIATDQDVKDVRAILLPNAADMTVPSIVGNIVGLFSPEIGAGMFILDLINKVVTSDKVSVQNVSLSTLLAKGGEVVYEERLPGKTVNGRFWLTRSIYYRVKLGNEMREIPLYVLRLPAEIK